MIESFHVQNGIWDDENHARGILFISLALKKLQTYFTTNAAGRKYFLQVFFSLHQKIGNLLKSLIKIHLFAEIFFQCQDLVHSSLVASAFKLCIQKSVDHHAGKARADHSAAEAQNIGIVV